MDPNDGPFDDQELIDILETAAQLYERAQNRPGHAGIHDAAEP